MIVTLIKKERIHTLYLPLDVKGQFWVLDKNKKDQTRKLLSIEAVSGKWFIKSLRQVRITDTSGMDLKTAEVLPQSFYRVFPSQFEEPALLIGEEVTAGRINFRKYFLNAKDGVSITIGRNSGNTIVFDNKFVSGTHCTLMYHKGRWTVQDNKSGNGTFVNSFAVRSKTIKPGDSIYVLGLTLITGNDYIAINNPDNNVHLCKDTFREYTPENIDPSRQSEEGQVTDYEVEYFYRTPRFKRELEKTEFVIDEPPQSPIGEEMPLLLTLGPSMTMAMMSLTTGGFAVMNAINAGRIIMAVPAIVMSISMLLGAILWPTLSRRYQRKKALQKEKIRQEKYREYLGNEERLITLECEKQEAILRENFVTIDECVRRVADVDISLWERGLRQNDFLRLRVGSGSEDLLAEIKTPEVKFALEEDSLIEEAASIRKRPKKLRNVPITTSFFENYFTSVIGERKKSIEFAHGLVVQLTAYYGYDDVKLVFLYDETEKSEFAYAKWLPHAWSDDKGFRMLATNMNEMKEVSAYLEKEIELRKSMEEKNIEEASPYYVIFAMSHDLALRFEPLRQLYNIGKNINFSVISFFDELKNVPKESMAVIELQNLNGKVFDKNDTTGISLEFTNDAVYSGDMYDYSLNLANIFLDVSSSTYQLPKMVTFLDMLGASNVEHLNASLRWKENEPTVSLQAPIGVNTFGDLFYLDLHEKYHGPHGLVAGTTGSGKSEFIISYILSLAVNYHPHEVAFILIDYKGGGMAKAFEGLPHTAGIITNLDGSAIKRSLVSINSELKHRQRVFNEASTRLGTRVADIYAYQKEYRNGKVDEPLPHLFIISDEFAELKSQQPDFMTELVSTARIGRSLGVHLILATQKPSGVVDDQIWSNSKFKLSLKVQDRSDSMEMLKRPDAADLSDTGRFYLLVGNNEVFEMGQSAWAGANYNPGEAAFEKNTCTVSFLDTNGRVVQTVKKEVEARTDVDVKKQLDVITDYISTTASEENVFTRKLWLPPIEALIFLDELHKKYPQKKTNKYSMNPLVGEIDDPAHQRRLPLTVPLTEEGNVVVYGSAGGGKATFMTTLVYDLLCTHTVETLNLYLVDLGAETLRAFRNAPQVGDVVFSEDSEKMLNLLKMIRGEAVSRKKLFSEWGGDHASYCAHSGNVSPNILVVINNYANFRELFQDYEELLVSITQECTKYGIYFIITTTSASGISYRLTQNCGRFIALQFNDEMDYSAVVGRTDGLYPAKVKGRGLVNLGVVYEFQTAHISEPKTIADDIKNLCETLTAMPHSAYAKRIPVLPEVVNPEFFRNTQPSIGRFPIGVEKSKLNTVYLQFTSSFVTVVAASEVEKTAPFIQGVAEMLSEQAGIPTVVLDAGKLFSEDKNRKYEYHNVDLEEHVISLFRLTKERDTAYKKDGKADFGRRVYVIPSLEALNKVLPDGARERLDAVLECGSPDLGINIILGECQNSLSQQQHSGWYQEHCKGNGIWVGDGVMGQYCFNIKKPTSELYEEMGDLYGISVKNEKFTIFKILRTDLANSEEEEAEHGYIAG